MTNQQKATCDRSGGSLFVMLHGVPGYDGGRAMHKIPFFESVVRKVVKIATGGGEPVERELEFRMKSHDGYRYHYFVVEG